MDRRGAALRYWSVLVLVSVGIAWSLVYAKSVKDGREADRKTIAALAAQVRALGGTPVAGPTGAAGRDGRDGTDGRNGTDGRPGSPGPTGAPGRPGPSGATGATGKAGPTGPAGVGSVGPAGPIGPTGATGPTGPKGEPGDKGDTGEPGQSVMCAEGYHPENIIIAPYTGYWQVCRKDYGHETLGTGRSAARTTIPSRGRAYP